jgi:hypothetical protein
MTSLNQLEKQAKAGYNKAECYDCDSGAQPSQHRALGGKYTRGSPL